MPVVEIYFSGLICHIGPSEKEGSDRTTLVKSILLDDRDYHVPRILTSVTETDTTVQGGPDILYTIFGEKLHTGVRFTNLGTVANTLNLFRDTVPHLDDLTRSGVSLNSNPPGLTVQLPAGSFTVAHFYDKGAIWTLDDNVTTYQCVPQVTMLRATGSNVVVHFNGQDVPLDEDGGWVLITNLEYELAVDYVPGQDWQKQHAMTTGDAYDIAAWEELPAPLDETTCQTTPPPGKYTEHVLKIFKKSKLVDTSECTNSHWP